MADESGTGESPVTPADLQEPVEEAEKTGIGRCSPGDSGTGTA